MWPLALLALTVTVLAAGGVLPRWPGLVHLTALPPLDLYTDLRIIVVWAPSWWTAITALTAALVLRITLLAYLTGPLTKRNLLRAARLYGVLSIPMTIAALAVAVASSMPNARYFWGGVAIVVVTMVFSAVLPWQRTWRLRSAFLRNWQQGLRLEVMVSYLAVMVGIGALAHLAPDMVLWLVPASALTTACALRALSRPPVPRPRLLVGTVAAVVLLAAAALMWPRWTDDAVQTPPQQEGSLMLMGGIVSYSGGGTIIQTDPEPLGYSCAQLYYFSYAGPGDGQPQGDAVCPITTGAPYLPEHTQRPLEEQVQAFVEQTEDLPRPLVVAGHSHAIWVAWEALARGEVQLDALVMVGPLPDSPVGYPPSGEHGQGRVLGDVLRLASPLGALADFEFDPEAPAAQQLQGTPNTSREILEQPLAAEVQTLSVMTAGDLPLMPGGWELDVDRNVCPIRSAHPDLPLSADYTEEFIRFLDGQPGRDCPVWRDWGAVLTIAFGAPPSR